VLAEKSGSYIYHQSVSSKRYSSSRSGVRIISVLLFFCLASGVFPVSSGRNSPLPDAIRRSGSIEELSKRIGVDKEVTLENLRKAEKLIFTRIFAEN